ncbi:hypothetical protein [Chryseobacterium scophthalmum]|uniref:hypothetical protein n=1 Tax=Chryseobacterium scophthalmum TaxID=59733 RepID=UPI001AEC402F|nr:hypothetical protein [Chryseobacterium scophthalmum]
MKSDLSIHNICIASIKRSTIKPYNFKWTRSYETDSKNLFAHFPFEIDEQELIICSTIIDSDNFSVLTTRKFITNENGKLQFGNLINAKDELYGDFKSKINEFTFGNVLLENGKNLKYFIETKTASMIMIRGVKTSIKIQQKTVNS